jgi:DNA mismatch repair protein MLH1
MFPILNPDRINPAINVNHASTEDRKSREVEESECFLTSVKKLRESLAKGKHMREDLSGLNFRRTQNFVSDLTEILQKHTFVGIVDLDRCLSLIQHSTKLYLVNHGALA